MYWVPSWLNLRVSQFSRIILISLSTSIYFGSVLPFYSPWKYEKTRGLLQRFSKGSTPTAIYIQITLPNVNKHGFFKLIIGVDSLFLTYKHCRFQLQILQIFPIPLKLKYKACFTDRRRMFPLLSPLLIEMLHSYINRKSIHGIVRWHWLKSPGRIKMNPGK